MFVPMEYIIPDGENLPNHEWATRVFQRNVTHLRECELVVAVYHGHYSDTGTAWEIGYAYTKQIPILLVHVDKTITASIMPVNSSMMNITIEDLRKISVGAVFKPYYSGLNTFLVKQK